MLFENQIVVYKTNVDVTIYVVGSPEENELQLELVRQTLIDSWGMVMPGKFQVEKRTIIEHLDMVALCMDEIIDHVLSRISFSILVHFPILNLLIDLTMRSYQCMGEILS